MRTRPDVEQLAASSDKRELEKLNRKAPAQKQKVKLGTFIIKSAKKMIGNPTDTCKPKFGTCAVQVTGRPNRAATHGQSKLDGQSKQSKQAGRQVAINI